MQIAETHTWIHRNVETKTILALPRHKALWNFQFNSTSCSKHTGGDLLVEKQWLKLAQEILRVCFLMAFIPPSEPHSQLRKATITHLFLGQVTCSSVPGWRPPGSCLCHVWPVPLCAASSSSFYPLHVGLPHIPVFGLSLFWLSVVGSIFMTINYSEIPFPGPEF